MSKQKFLSAHGLESFIGTIGTLKNPTYQDPFPTYQGHPPQWMDLEPRACCWRFPLETAWTLGVPQSHQFTFGILWLMFQTDRKVEILEFKSNTS